MILKKMTAVLSALAMSAGALAAMPANTIAPEAASKYNYAEALQKSMFFYEVQQAGILPEWNEVQWRADSMVKEDGTPSDVVDGGWFDAGDHYKFTLTNAYSASVLAWGYIQNKDAVDKAGLGEIYRNNVEWGLDYVLGCDKGGGKMIGTIGDSDDHVVWCSAEVYMRKHTLKTGDEVRPYDTITDSTTVALSAAALAEGYIIFKDSKPEKAAEYLKHAKSLFESADATRSNKDQGTQKNFYPTTSWVDDCMYAANWLYMATGDQSYLDICEKDYIPNFPLESQSDQWKYTWGFCWDDTTQGAALLYAINTGKTEWIDHISHHLDYWIDGYGGKKVDYTPDGLAYLMNWGSLRHAANTCWIAEVACDTIFKDDASKCQKYEDWAKSQMDYMFGDNGNKMSYVLGMGDNQPTAFHHRTASGIHDDHWNDLGKPASAMTTGSGDEWQTEYAHTLYGALVGGPDKGGSYKNDVAQYEYSEVAIDYNAGFTATLTSYIGKYGGTILADFPPVETPTWDEWEVAAVLNGSGDSYTEIKAWAMNHTAWPARVAKDISYRYYFDISELLDAGLSADDVKVEGKAQQYSAGEQGYATVSGPYQYDGNIYYAEVKFEDGRAIQPTGQSEHRDEVQFRVSIPDAIDGKSTKGAWDPSNDWSYEGVTKSDSLKSSKSLNKHFTMYVDGKLVWGEEPDGTVPAPYTPPKETGKQTTTETTTTTTTTTETTTTTTTTSTTSTTSTTQSTTETTTTTKESQGGVKATKWGDANCDDSINMGDVVLIMQSIANMDRYGIKGSDDTHITEQGLANADVYENGSGITGNDALAIQKFLLDLISELPES